VQAIAGAPDWAEVVTAAERPDLWAAVRSEGRFASVWPEYNLHGNHTPRYFGALVPAHAAFQVLVIDRRTDSVVARGRTIPFRWDGTLEDLPTGIDAVGRRAVDEDQGPTALSALAAEVHQQHQGQGLSSLVIQAMGAAARTRDLHPLVAPVRPTWKDRYPLTPIDQYARWTRADGASFDPWIRVHTRLGGSVLRAEPESMEFSHPVRDWERWVDLEFPEDGTYVFPGGLAPLIVTNGVGHYWEPNVWIVHDL
jgi:GNAT superfamily N-acetyltransferase